MKKEIKEFLKDLKKRGYTINHGKNHIKVVHPDIKRTVVFSGTPSCPHAVKHMKSDIERLEDEVSTIITTNGKP